MSRSSKMLLTNEYDFNDELSPNIIKRQSTYHPSPISQLDQNKKDDKKVKLNHFDLNLRIKIKKTPTNGLRNIYEENENNGNANELLTSSQRENLPRSILKKKVSAQEITAKGISFTCMNTNDNNKDNKEKEKDNNNNKGEKTVSFGHETDHLITIYEPNQTKIKEEIHGTDNVKCKCDCFIF